MAGLVSLALVALLPGTTAAGAGAATLADLEDEVMCPICGTLLELSEAPQAQRQRAYISRLIAAGESKSAIKDALVAQYGREVLALPRGSGFDLSAYLVPLLALLAAVAALAIGVARWHRTGRPSALPAPQDGEAARLDADIARYDL